jgi:hypothetical protein
LPSQAPAVVYGIDMAEAGDVIILRHIDYSSP